MDADVLAQVALGGVPGPGTRDHQRGAGGHAVPQRLVDRQVGGVRGAEVVAVEDQQPGVGGVPQALGQRGHPGNGTGHRDLRPVHGRAGTREDGAMTDTPTPPPTAPLWAPSEPSHAPVGRILMIVAGILIVLAAGLVALVGAGLTWAHTTQRDSDGFFSTSAERLDTATPAITSDELDLGVSPHDARWFDAGDLATVRIDVDGVGEPRRVRRHRALGRCGGLPRGGGPGPDRRRAGRPVPGRVRLHRRRRPGRAAGRAGLLGRPGDRRPAPGVGPGGRRLGRGGHERRRLVGGERGRRGGREGRLAAAAGAGPVDRRVRLRGGRQPAAGVRRHRPVSPQRGPARCRSGSGALHGRAGAPHRASRGRPEPRPLAGEVVAADPPRDHPRRPLAGGLGGQRHRLVRHRVHGSLSEGALRLHGRGDAVDVAGGVLLLQRAWGPTSTRRSASTPTPTTRRPSRSPTRNGCPGAWSG